ncbi:GAF domain-containing protein [Pedobacter sp. L105]|uniref:GAF domain-containing protein n=1 Tax=Pedobacter sp. L105 TaxID=1641871 RepID=UPI00131CC490|nr:GAF domain-containing protein [Pedobacter sp. L105]
MNNAKIKQNQLVEKFNLLNFSTNKELNDLVILTVEICKIPVVLLTLNQGNNQTIRYKFGLDLEEAQVETLLSEYFKSDTTKVVSHAVHDLHCQENTAATEDLTIRFYTSVPLVSSSGIQIGSYCIADFNRHHFTDHQEEMLAILSRQVMYVTELQLGLDLIKDKNIALKAQKTKKQYNLKGN